MKVQTQNLYLGSDLNGAIAAQTPQAFFQAANQIWANVKASDFPARAEVIARQIALTQPDIVALQEVSNWTATNLSSTSHEPSFDFLAILQSALARRGQSYSVKATSNNANIGPLPLPGPPPAAQFLLQFQDRDVILVRNRPGLAASGGTSANYVNQQSFTSAIGVPISFNRGWASTNVVADGRSFKFVDTHLEVEGFPTVQENQARELINGPLNVPGKVVVAGDFNSAADGSQTQSYGLVRAAGFADSWLAGPSLGNGFSCCQAGDLLNTTSLLNHRIDFVFAKRANATPVLSFLVGSTQLEKTSSGRWPSDHAGVFTALRP